MIRIPQKDGSFKKISKTRKKRSAGKKRGRPRKTIIQELKPKSRKRPYSIILTSRGKQKKTLKTFKDEQEAYAYLGDLLYENNKVKFPVKYINTNHKLEEAKYELYIIKRLDENSGKEVSYLKNDYGEFIEYSTNSEKWCIVDKSPWSIEETFWVNGYDPVFQRKTFDWILNELLLKINDYYSFKNVLVYHNKLIIECNGELNVVFCKNISDSYRLYNTLEEKCNDLKNKSILFSGSINAFSKSTISTWIDRLCSVTGFDRKKIKRNSLRP